jgi:hypothetical protein
MGRHFLGRIWGLVNSKQNGGSRVTPDGPVTDDLRHSTSLLGRAHRGISINLLTTRKPSRLLWSDSCPFGIGGYSLVIGQAWRIQTPKASIIYGSNRVNNLLEFLGMGIGILLELRDCGEEEQACILSTGDNTSAIGWIFNSARLLPTEPAHEAHRLVARTIA